MGVARSETQWLGKAMLVSPSESWSQPLLVGDLSANFPHRVGGRVNIDIGVATLYGTHCSSEISWRNALIGGTDDVSGRNGPAHRATSWTSRFAAASTEEGNHTAIDATLGEVNMGDGYLTGQLRIGQDVGNGTLADGRSEGSGAISEQGGN